MREKANLKLKAAQCLARLTHAHAASAFTAWVDWAAEQKEHRLASEPYLPQKGTLAIGPAYNSNQPMLPGSSCRLVFSLQQGILEIQRAAQKQEMHCMCCLETADGR